MDDAESRSRKLVLNAGSGRRTPNSLHPCFAPDGWRELRFDIDPAVEPDVVGSVTDLRPHFGDASFDAIWSSHNIEHLHGHEVPVTLAEFRRVLKPDGFALITCPDLQAVAADLIERGLDHKAYDSPAGPISVHDMMFGHGASIAAGNVFMAHRTGFTQERLGTVALDAGFTEIRVGSGGFYDLWAVLAMPDCSAEAVRTVVRGTHLEFLFSDAGAAA